MEDGMGGVDEGWEMGMQWVGDGDGVWMGDGYRE